MVQIQLILIFQKRFQESILNKECYFTDMIMANSVFPRLFYLFNLRTFLLWWSHCVSQNRLWFIFLVPKGLCIHWLAFINLTQDEVIWEEETSGEKLPPSDCQQADLLDTFLLMIDVVVGSYPLWVVSLLGRWSWEVLESKMN